MPTLLSCDLIKDTSSQTQQEIQRVQVYRLVYDALATSLAARTASGIPLINSFDSGLHVVNIQADADTNDPARVWLVTVTYSNRVDSASEGGASGTTPYSTTIANDGVMYEEALIRDFSISGDQWGEKRQCVIKETNEPIDPPIMGEYWDSRYTITFYVHALSNTLADAIDECRGSLNDATVTMNIKGQSRIFEKRCLKLAEAGYEYRDAQTGWVCKYVIHYRKPYSLDGDGGTSNIVPGWAEARQSKSFYHLNGDGQLVRNKDADGKPKPTPSYLDSQGNEIGPGSTAVPSPTAFFRNKTRSWTTILSGITTIA